jgi:hypothetical protein
MVVRQPWDDDLPVHVEQRGPAADRTVG